MGGNSAKTAHGERRQAGWVAYVSASVKGSTHWPSRWEERSERAPYAYIEPARRADAGMGLSCLAYARLPIIRILIIDPTSPVRSIIATGGAFRLRFHALRGFLFKAYGCCGAYTGYHRAVYSSIRARLPVAHTLSRPVIAVIYPGRVGEVQHTGSGYYVSWHGSERDIGRMGHLRAILRNYTM